MILERILTHKQGEVKSAQARCTLDALKERCQGLPETRGFERQLRRQAGQGTAIIAEVKKGSPSKGIIRADFDPVAIARGYEKGGASCLSVLTDENFFFGHLDFLRAIADAVSLPLLRKDFIVDSYQIYEARANRADAVLLIAAALDFDQICAFHELASGLGLDVLLEVHNEKELETALRTPCTLLGINNRCLKTFVTDLAVSERLLEQIPPERFVVSESGLHQRADIERLQQAGAGAFLIGESLMRETDFVGKLEELLGREPGAQ
ncbi:MAG: indole-3-glycerol phosphate synthase TrpC [Desulfuromonadaceae bacterium]|nr:indole-3-glycerol phosphate synthase TrpC [Desulfuromonadaceae bacterium]